MPIGLDMTQRIAPAALRAAGVNVVCRYIAPQDWKVIHQAEYDELVAAGYIPGYTLFLNWESSASDWNDGALGGYADGTSAVAKARALGYPPGAIIIGSADYDHKNLDVVRAYGAAFKSAVEAGGYRAGVYGPWDVLSVCQGLGFSFYWQCMSTSYSANRNRSQHPATNLWQKGYKTVGGVQADYSDIVSLPSSAHTVQPVATRNEVVAMNPNQEALLRAVFGVEESVTLYKELSVLKDWNVSNWVSDLGKQGHAVNGVAVTWPQIVVINPGILDNVDLPTNTFKAAAKYLDPTATEVVQNPLAAKLSAGTADGAPSVDLDALAAKVAVALGALVFQATPKTA